MRIKLSTALVLILTLALAAPAFAAKKKVKPVKVKATLALTAAPLPGSATTIRPAISASFKAPKRGKRSQSCKGAVKFSVPVGKKKVKKKSKKKAKRSAGLSAKKKKKSKKTVTKTIYATRNAKLKVSGKNCLASGPIKLPSTLIGKKLKFSAVFKGNKRVKKFTRRANLVVRTVEVPPPAPPTPPTPPQQPSSVPSPTTWLAYLPGESGPIFWFEVKSDLTVDYVAWVSPLVFQCTDGPQEGVTTPPPIGPVSFASPPVTVTDIISKSFNDDEDLHSDFSFSFSSPTSGTLIYSGHGTVSGNGDDHRGCSVSGVVLNLSPGLPPG